ncbi:MAG: DNA polymerase III subunit delta' [Acidobacteriota bacterium]
MFATLAGNNTNKEILRRLVKNDRLGATMIFAGPDGVGKRLFALTLAKAANCLNPPQGIVDSCDICPSCFRIDQGSHGDVVTVQADGPYIKVGQARELAENIRYRPFEGRQRFFIIDEADRLREEAANALLKTFEEPPPTSTLILITARPDALLPTIRSRAQKIAFAPLSLTEMEAFIASNHPRPEGDQALLARLSEGRVGRALSIDLADYRRDRRELIELLELLASGENRYRLLKAGEYLGKHEREAFEKKLDLLARLLRDMVLLSSERSNNEIINFDEGERLARLSSRIGWERLVTLVDRLNQLRLSLMININRQIAMESLLQELVVAPS